MPKRATPSAKVRQTPRSAGEAAKETAAASKKPAPSTRRRSIPATESALPVEVVFFYLYDAGRNIDLGKVIELVPAHKDLGLAKSRDTPSSISLPTALVLSLASPARPEQAGFTFFSAYAKIYEEGVVTIVIRGKASKPLSELHQLETLHLDHQGRSMTVQDFAEDCFVRLFEALSSAVTEPRAFEDMGRESYIAYCLADCGGMDPHSFLEQNREYCACLLTGMEPGCGLHESQIEATLAHPFRYLDGDLAVFELDRCLIIDPRLDYEDLLLIAEHANYQLLELRVLDSLLDTWLDEAEDDIRHMSTGQKRMALLRGGVEIKSAHIQSLRFDALFILENLENSSKIIGDYYLGKVYERLCSLFNTEGWKWSVERRLDVLQDVYEMVTSDSNERKLRWLEVVVIIVCVAAPVVEMAGLILFKG